MKKIYLFSFLLILLASTLHAQQQGGGFYDQLGQEGDHAQSIQQLEKAAQKAHNKGDHYSAMQWYSRIITVDSAYAPAWRGFAEAAFDQGAYEKSATAWEYLAKLNPEAPDWSAWLKVADIAMRLGDYRKAERLYTRLHLQEDNLSAQQKKDLAEADRRYERALEATLAVSPVSLIILNKPLNTEFAEISPFPFEQDLYYASFDFELKKDSHKPKRRQMRAMKAVPDGNDFGVAQTDFNNDVRHTANATFSADGQRMFYSLCDYVDTSSTATICELYMRTRNADGNSWGEPVKLPEHINRPGYTATQPNLGQMPGVSGEVLFFVSNYPISAKGRRDIWYSRILPEGFGAPVNFAAVNTPSNEASPFYHALSGKFYFASDDNEQSLGGYDIFTVKPGGEGWEEKVNLGSPINSGGDDLYMSLTPKGNTAFFSTNRLAVGKALETANEDGCCFDIVRVDLVPPPVIAIPFEKFTNFKDTLTETRFTLWRKDKDSWVKDTAVDIAGKMWKFSVPPGVEYKLVCDKPGYSSDTVPVLIPLNTWDDKPRIVRLELTPQRVNLVVYVIDGETGLPLNGTVGELAEWSSPNAKPFLRDSARYSATDTHRYPLDFERQYQATVSKQGYVTEDGKKMSTIGLTRTQTLRDTIKLYRGVEFIASAFDLSRIDPKTDKNLPLKGVTFRLVDDSTGKSYTFTNRQGHTWQRTIYRDHRYTIVAAKPQYTTDSLPFNPSQLIDKTKALDTVRQDLFLRPDDLVSYLPIKLYFDNDYPDPKTQRDTTEKLYVTTYIPYYQRKEVFMEENKKVEPGRLPFVLEAVDAFFDSDVKGEWNRMRYFTEVLFEKLQKGSRIEITIKGFASPRAGSEYNKLLTARRIASVMNHFAGYDGELLKKYMASGQLVVTEVPNGEELAPKDIEDTEPRGSIYSVEASRERRIEIIGVEISGGGPSGK